MADDDPDVINLDKARRGKWLNDCIKGAGRTNCRSLPMQ